MYIKSIGYVFLLVNLIMAFNFCGFSSQSSYEEMFYAELLTKHEKLQIITANFNSYDPPDLQELQFAQNILDKNYTYYESEDDLEEINQEKMGKEISFLDKIVPEFKKINKLTSKEVPSLFTLISVFNKIQNIEGLIFPSLHKKVEENINLQEQMSFKRASIFLDDLDKISVDKNTLYIVVLHEAFFNYFNNPRGFGNFIPFKEETFRKIMEIIEEKTQKRENLLFIPNFVYHDYFSNLSNYAKNFNIFAQHSFKQKKILGRYDKLLLNEKITPIKNESFVFFNGNVSFKYQKQFILDEDIPDFFYQSKFTSNYFPLYIPGIDENGKILRIEICQDHESLSTKQNYNLDYTKFFIVQSASIELRDKILSDKKYTGAVIHADSNISNNKIIIYQNGEKMTIKPLFEKPIKINDVFFNQWDISSFKDFLLKKK